MVTHEDDIAAFAKRHLVMRDGKIMVDDEGSPKKSALEVGQLVKEALK
jgi:ABC-type lipoprotein export system ATPase subunit